MNLNFLFLFIYLFILATPGGMRDLSSPTRDLTVPPAVDAWSLNQWTAREVLDFFFHKQKGGGGGDPNLASLPDAVRGPLCLRYITCQASSNLQAFLLAGLSWRFPYPFLSIHLSCLSLICLTPCGISDFPPPLIRALTHPHSLHFPPSVQKPPFPHHLHSVSSFFWLLPLPPPLLLLPSLTLNNQAWLSWFLEIPACGQWLRAETGDG